MNLVFPFLMHNESKSIPDSQRDAVTFMSLYPWLQTLLSLSVHMFLYCFRPWSYTLNVLSYCRVWLIKCCKSKNSCMKIYFHSIKTALYLIKYIFSISPCFSWYQKTFSFSQNKFVFSKNHFYHTNFCFILVKYVFIIEIFHWILFWWGYLVFLLYLQNSEFQFQHVNWTTTRGCKKAIKKDIRVWCYESWLNTKHLAKLW